MKYFTNQNNTNVFSGKAGMTNFPTAYEESSNTSPGVFNAANAASGTTCANLAPGCGFSDTCRTSGIQTGGRRGRRHRRRGPQRSRRSRTSRRSASKSRTRTRRKSIRRKSIRRKNIRRKSNRRQRGGGGSYGRTVLPAKYYGGETDVFTAPPGCQTFETAYGMSNPSIYSDFQGDMVNRNLAPGGQTAGTRSSGIQTGGGGTNKPYCERKETSSI